MRRALLLGAITAALGVTGARAVDWSVRSTVSESVELNDNPQLVSPSKGAGYNSYTNLFADVLGATPTSRFEAFGNLKYRAYSGPGEEGQLNAWDKDITARYSKDGQLTTYNVYGSYSEVQSSALQLVETGLATATGSTITSTVGGEIRHDFSPIDNGGLNASYNSVSFTGTGGSPYNALTTTADWRHRMSQVVDFLPSLQVQRLAYSDFAQSRVLFAVANLGFRAQLSPRATFYVAAGPDWAEVTNSANVPAALQGPSGLSTGTSLDWSANGQLTYRWTPTLTAVLNASRTTGPTTFGAFQTSEQVSGSLAYDINILSTISATEGFSHIAGTAGAAPADIITTTVAYSRQLTHEWRFSASYQYIQRNSDQPARSNSVLLTISKDFTVVPP